MEKTNEINIMDILYIIRKHIIAIVSVAVIMAIVSYIYTITLVTPMYRSSAHLLIKALTNDAMTVYSDSSSRVMLVNNCIEVLSGTEIMQSVVDELALDITPEEALTGTTALNTIALQKGAHILRVHDVREAVETVKIVQKMKACQMF